MSRVAVVVNGAAGGGSCAQRVGPHLDRLAAAWPEGEVQRWFTAGAGDATRLARRAADEGAELVVAVGGDGTVFEVLNGLVPGDRGTTPALGILPLGTGNSFVRDLGLVDPDAATAALVRGGRRPCDVVRAEHTGGALHYLNLLSVGFTATVGALTNRRLKPLGRGGYVVAVVASLARLGRPRYPLRADGGPRDDRDCTLLSFSNSRYTGGDMLMAPGADLADGLLDLVRVGPMRRRELLLAFPRIFRGTHGELDAVELSTARRVELELDAPVDVMVDGEILRLQLTALEVLPGALQVVA